MNDTSVFLNAPPIRSPLKPDPEKPRGAQRAASFPHLYSLSCQKDDFLATLCCKKQGWMCETKKESRYVPTDAAGFCPGPNKQEMKYSDLNISK